MDRRSSDVESRVAVICVHGVANQARFQTQKATATLLSTGEHQNTYSDFTESQTSIPQHEVKLAREIDLAETSKQCRGPRSLHTTGLVSRLSAFKNSRIYFKTGKPLDLRHTERGDDQSHFQSSLDNCCHSMSVEEVTEHESMREQLQDFEKPRHGETLDIKVITGKRINTETENACRVDLYEMHWADLSRVGGGFFSFFFEFYLLLYFLPRIGSQTMERARPFDSDKKWYWQLAFLSHIVAEYLLVVIVPIMYLCVLSTMACLFTVYTDSVTAESDTANSVALLLILLSIGVVFVYWLFVKGREHDQYWHWFSVPVGATIVLAFLIYLSVPVSLRWSTVFSHLVLCLVILFAMYVYKQRQTGAFAASVLLTGVTFAGTTFLQFDAGAVDIVVEFMRGFQFSGKIGNSIYEGLNAAATDGNYAKRIFYVSCIALFFSAASTAVVIGLFIALSFVSYIAGAIATDLASEEKRPYCSRLFWTASTTLIVSGLLAILITFSLWELLYHTVGWWYGGYLNVSWVPDTLRHILDVHYMPGVSWIALIIIGVLFYVGWIVVPAPMSDVVKQPGNTAELGALLDRSFTHLNYAVWVLTVVFFILIPFTAFIRVTGNPGVSNLDRNVVLGTALMVIVLMFGRGPAVILRNGFGAALDITLDVTNWFRVQPRTANAKAAICRRYVSILRYLSSWHDPDTKKPYDAVLIVAHSQGTVITADLLRFLKKEQILTEGGTDPELQAYFAEEPGTAQLPISLLTFGSPLQQLYNRRFPHQYAWCESSEMLAERSGADPDSLGVDVWRNIYMSGDYVGRCLWLPDRPENKQSACAPDHRFETDRFIKREGNADAYERCAGFGGHTGYWKGSSPLVGATIDSLIARIAKKDQ